MSMNSTPTSNRVHIAIFGRRNAGKSSLINAITGQNAAIVSDTPGTTTDPVSKTMELLPLGPVVIIDTPGLDDEGELGAQRVKRALGVLGKTDIAVVVADPEKGLGDTERRVMERAEKMNIPCLLVSGKADLNRAPIEGAMCVSALTGQGVQELKEALAHIRPSNISERPILSDLVKPGDMILFVTPCDASAPKGRLILPQQQSLRDALDHHCLSAVVQDTEVKAALAALKNPPALVVTDSQAFAQVSRDVPEDIPLTSFSILFARHKGFLDAAIQAVDALEHLRDGDRLLIAEGCTHHRQCEDIGTVKIPKMLRAHTGKELEFDFTSGGTFPEDLSGYRLVIHCGGCMLNEREMRYRLEQATVQGVPFINYGITIAHVTGVLKRSLRPLGL
jgi:[FeFe] hydrogenase H-cluster maturation GTPase HydF